MQRSTTGKSPRKKLEGATRMTASRSVVPVAVSLVPRVHQNTFTILQSMLLRNSPGSPSH